MTTNTFLYIKNYILAMTILVVFSACKQNNAKPETIETSEETVEVVEVEKANYPENLTKVFDAHGAIDAWKAMKSKAFTMEKSDRKEVTTTNLNSRDALIESPNANIGFDGRKAWFF